VSPADTFDGEPTVVLPITIEPEDMVQIEAITLEAELLPDNVISLDAARLARAVRARQRAARGLK
jgi:hypothetical protein